MTIARMLAVPLLAGLALAAPAAAQTDDEADRECWIDMST